MSGCRKLLADELGISHRFEPADATCRVVALPARIDATRPPGRPGAPGAIHKPLHGFIKRHDLASLGKRLLPVLGVVVTARRHEPLELPIRHLEAVHEEVLVVDQVLTEAPDPHHLLWQRIRRIKNYRIHRCQAGRLEPGHRRLQQFDRPISFELEPDPIPFTAREADATQRRCTDEFPVVFALANRLAVHGCTGRLRDRVAGQ